MNSQFSRYLLAGVFNTLCGWVIIFIAMYLLRMTPEASNVLGYSIGLLISFELNRTFIFRSSGQSSGELVRFFTVFGIAFGMNLLVLYVSVRILMIHEVISQVLAGFVYVASSYTMNKKFVFQQCRNDQGTGF